MTAVTPEVQQLLVGVRRRLRISWSVATFYWLAPAVALVALLLVLVGRIRPWWWPEPAAVAAVAPAVAGIAAAAVLQRISLRRAALAADRSLRTHDAFSTALELEAKGVAGPFAQRVAVRAGELASRSTSREAIRFPRPGRRVGAGAAIGGVALLLALLANPQDAIRRTRATEQRAIEALADELETERAALAERATTDGERAVLDELTATATELRAAEDLTQAEEILRRASSDLSAQVPADLLAAKAASKGLAHNLEARPLGGGGGSVASQLAEAAAGLDQLSPEEREALAERLAELAESQRVGDPTLAKELAAAASAVSSGDTGKAAASLQSAANAAAATQARVANGETARAAANAATASANRANQARAQGQGKGQGAGQGAGQGQGQGQGAGQGEGQGQGQGQGSGGGSPSGVVSGQGSGTGGRSQGGQGRPGGQAEAGPASAEKPQLGDLNLPPEATDGETMNAGGTPTGDPGEVVGKGDGPTQGGTVTVAVSDVLPSYRDQALDAIDRTAVSPADRQLVTDYFDQLADPNQTGS